MKGRLVKLAGKFYLTLANFETMAKDLDENTLVFCHSEIHMNDEKECIRHSTKGDNCYGCQPLIASTNPIEGVARINTIAPFPTNPLNDGESMFVDYTSMPIFNVVLIKELKDE